MAGFDSKQEIVDDYLHLPSRAGRYALDEFKKRTLAKHKITWGVPSLDSLLIPMVPGDLVSVLGRPSNGKTLALVHLSKQANRIFSKEGGNRYVMYATWETLVEEFVAINTAGASGITLEDIGRGNANISKLTGAVARNIKERTAVFGRSMETKGRIHTIDDLNVALEWMTENGTPVGLLIFDYLQRAPGRPGQERSQAVSENLERLKDMAIVHKTPVVVAIQSKRDVDDYSGLKMPGMGDGQWSSNIEQTSDKVLGVTRPILYMDAGTVIEKEGEDYVVGEKTLAIGILKQRWGKAGRTMILGANPGLSTIEEHTQLSKATF